MTMQSNGISASSSTHAITLAILAMGGEGGGVLADWIVDVAEHCGFIAQTTSVPGVAQRTGSTIYYVEMFPEGPAHASGKDPVLALMPVPGEVDIVLASELMEAGRAVQRGLVTQQRTTLVASTNRVYSMTEKTAVSDGQADATKLVESCRAAAKRFVAADFFRLAEEKRSAISAALLGGLAGTGALPFPKQEFEEAISRSGVGVDASLAAFAAGYEIAHAAPKQLPEKSSGTTQKAGPRLRPLLARVQTGFPVESQDILFLGIERLADYQDEKYASVYLDRLESILDIEVKRGGHDFQLLNEAARYLALWMSYEDAARVADLKTRRARFQRVRNESRAQSAQLVQINEFIYPRIEEIADMMPASMGRWMLASPTARRLAERLLGHGRVVETTSVSGFLQLYLVAELRRWRRRSLRFQEEQSRIERWLQGLKEVAREDYAAAERVAEFPRVMKGYGETHVNGVRKFESLMKTLSLVSRREDAAAILRSLIDAALADENGTTLQESLDAIIKSESLQPAQLGVQQVIASQPPMAR